MVNVAIDDLDKRWSGRRFLVLCKCAMVFDPRFKNTLKESDHDTASARKLIDKEIKQMEQMEQMEQKPKKRHHHHVNEDPEEEEEDSQPNIRRYKDKFVSYGDAY